MRAFALDAEILKLARVLAVEPEDLACLRHLDVHTVRELREQVRGAMAEADRQTLQRVAVATRMLPVKLAAAMAERGFGPRLAARLTTVLEPERAVDIATRLPTAFLADLVGELDPRHTRSLIAKFPPDHIARVAKELAEREEYVTMGALLGPLPARALRAVLEVVDDEALLHAAYVGECKDSIGELLMLLPRARLASIMRTATEDPELHPEALDVLSHVSGRQRDEVAEIAAEHGFGALLADLDDVDAIAA